MTRQAFSGEKILCQAFGPFMKKAVLSSSCKGLQLSGWDLNFSIQKNATEHVSELTVQGAERAASLLFQFLKHFLFTARVKGPTSRC